MYVPSLSPNGEILVEVLRGKGEFIVTVPIGYDPDRDLVYSVFAALSPLAGYADVPGFELVFNILEVSTDGADVYTCWDGNASKAFLTDPDQRRLVRGVVCTVVETLIDVAEPNLVSMITHVPDLPRKALGKFHDICAVFTSKGFTAGKADTWHGQHIWMMFRQEPPDGTDS